MQPKWATETIREGTSIGLAILADPTILLEGLAQQATDAVEEEGIAYCIGYVAGDILGGKGLGKLAEAGKVGKLSKAGLTDDIVDEVPNVIKKSTDGVKPPVIDITETAAEAMEAAPELTSLYRAVGPDEFYKVMETGTFDVIPEGLQAKQFGLNLQETINFAEHYPDLAAVLEVKIPENVLAEIGDLQSVDGFIFRNGTVTIHADKLDEFNNFIEQILHVY